jgi:hypothetical protein
LGSGDARAAAVGAASRGLGRTLPVLPGSSCEATVCAVDWNMSPSRVEVSQPLSHNRHATVATTTRRARAFMHVPPAAEHRITRPEAKAGDAVAVTSIGRLGDDG